MKKIIYLCLFITCFASNAQQINYEFKKNDPNDICNFVINLDLLNMDLNMVDLSTMSFGTGLWARAEFFDRIGAEATIRKSYLYFGKMFSDVKRRGNTELIFGGHLKFSDKTKIRSTKIILKEVQGYNSVTQTFIEVPANVRKSRELRGGLMVRSLSMELDEFTKVSNLNGDEIVNYFGTGFYAGISTTHVINAFINAKGYGYRGSSALTRFYADIIFMPVNTFSTSTGNVGVSKEVKDNLEKSTNPLGFRIGYELFQIETRDITGKRFGMSVDSQIGVKPYLGLFIGCSIGLSIIKERM
ncbi:MAG: hypothetical protein ACK4K0_12420 [Flavobacteriales bacterium]